MSQSDAAKALVAAMHPPHPPSDENGMKPRDGRRGKAVWKPASKDRGRSAGPQAEAPMRLGGSVERAGDSCESRPQR